MPEVYAAFLLLSNEPLYILRSHWVFDDGEREHPVGYLALQKALKSGSFQHPKTGMPVENWMNLVGIAYESGATLDALMTS